MLRARLLPALIAALGALAAFPGAALASVWSAPVALSSTGQYAQSSQSAAADASGAGIVGWSTESGSVAYAYRPAGGAFGPAHVISGSDGDTVHVAMNASGQAVIAWRDGAGAHAAYIGGPTAQPQQLHVQAASESEEGTAVLPGIDSKGAVYVFWGDSDGIWYTKRAPGGSFATPRFILAPSGEVNNYAVAVDPSGAAEVVWDDYHGVWAAAGSWASGFRTTELESNQDQGALYYDSGMGVPGLVSAAIDPAGAAVASWMGEDTATYAYDVMASVQPGGGSFGVPTLLTSDLTPLGFGAPAAIDPQGRPTVVWSGLTDTEEGVFAASSDAAGSFGAVTLPDAATGASAPCSAAVTTDDSGDVYVAWNEYDGESNGCQGDGGLQRAAIRRAGSGAFGAPATLARASTEDPPALAGTGASGALDAWIQGGSSLRVLASQG